MSKKAVIMRFFKVAIYISCIYFGLILYLKITLAALYVNKTTLIRLYYLGILI